MGVPVLWSSPKLSDISDKPRAIKAKPVDNPNTHMPKALKVRTFTLGGPGSGGPSFQIAENFGATPVQISTRAGKNLLTSNAEEGKYEQKLGGAGSIGGIPIVAPAGRTYSDEHEAVMKEAGIERVRFDSQFIDGTQGRFPAYKEKAISHGAIFSSQAWKGPKVQASGLNGSNAIEATYTLNFQDDDALKAMGKGKLEAIYTLAEGNGGEVVFDSRLKVSSEDGPVYIGSLAQHTFFETDEHTILQTSAPDEVKAPKDAQELPTGKIGKVTKKNDFREERLVHQDSGELEVVLTGYHKTEDKIPRAVLKRQGLEIISEAAGKTGDVNGYDGFLLCNKAGTGKVMLEPIARYPNIMNVYENTNRKSVKPVVVSPGNAFRAHYRIIAQAA